MQKRFTIQSLPKRPQINKKGAKMEQGEVVTNYYKLTNFANHIIYQYDITFEPALPEDSRELFKGLIASAEEQIKKKLKHYIHRGKIIYGFTKLGGPQSFACKYTLHKGKPDEQEFTNILTLKETKIFQLAALYGGSESAQKVLQVLNSDLKNKMQKANLKELGNTGKFYKTQKLEIQNSPFALYRGFTTSIHYINNDLQLLIDVSTRVIRNQNLLQTLSKLKSDEKDQLIGRSVIATYGNWKLYSIKKVRTNVKASHCLEGKEPKMTYVEYFKTRYGVIIKDVNQELIESSIKRKILDKDNKLVLQENVIYLVPEMVNLTGMSDEEKNNFNLMKEVANETKMVPNFRVGEVRKFLTTLQNSNLYDIQKTESKVPGYFLQQPTLIYANNVAVRPKNGVTVNREKVLVPMNTKDWIIVYTQMGNRDRDVCDDFVKTINSASNAFGIKLPEPSFIVIESGKVDEYIKKIQESVDKYGKPNFFVTLLKPNEKRYYSKLKSLFLSKLAVPHQNIVTSTITHEKRKMSACSKIVLQINAKVGCPLWKIEQKLPTLKNRKILLGGMAIYHKLINNNQSCCSFAGTVNTDQTEYYLGSKLVPQNSQIFDSLYQMVEEWVKTYCKDSKTVPDTLVIYRDGTGESQIPGIIQNQVKVIDRVIQTIKEKMKKPDYKPGVIFIMANKKINQKLYEEKAEGQSRTKGVGQVINPRSGTVVGGGISRYGFDFHMSPHNVTEGTCTPTQFNVIHNTSDLSEDEIWTLTFESCFGYYNWSGAVRVPAPLQYANKLATLVGDSMKCEPNDIQLKKKLYCL